MLGDIVMTVSTGQQKRVEIFTDSLGLRDRVAIVTGGGRGIGRATVERLAQAGVNVVVNYLSNESDAIETAHTAEKHGVSALTVRGDVAKVVEAEKVVEAALERFGRIDIVVCNAGLWEGAPVERVSEDLWNRVLDVNLKGSWTICRAAVPVLKRGGWGRLIIISSTAGQRGEAGYSCYAAAKGGQISFMKSLALELAPYRINVNAIAPGWVETEMCAEEYSLAGRRREIEESIPLGRIADPDDIARPVVFLCSEWARHITGEVLNINGGAVLCG